MALVGESGSGKSTVALSLLQLLPYPVARHSKKSSIHFKGRSWWAPRPTPCAGCAAMTFP
jgi:ABC-type microcin C transport system duplicated ATPase subunit YejF